MSEKKELNQEELKQANGGNDGDETRHWCEDINANNKLKNNDLSNVLGGKKEKDK